MADKQACDQYATEAARRFEEFTSWAIANWPDKNAPLLSADFIESRKELGMILGSKLLEGRTDAFAPRAGDQPQYFDMNPAPWP